MHVSLESYVKDARTLSFSVEDKDADTETIVVEATRLRELMLVVMGGKNERGAYNKDLRTAKVETARGDYDEIFLSKAEKAVFYFYIQHIFDYLRASTFNMHGSAINVDALDAAWKLENPNILDGDETKQWWNAFIMLKLV